MVNYSEAFPHLLLQSFLQRVTNGEVRIEREYAAGRGRMDLAVEYRGSWDIIEIKLLGLGKSLESLVPEGKKQIMRCRDSFSRSLLRSADGKPVACCLIVFDRRPDKETWEERLFWIKDGDITVVGC